MPLDPEFQVVNVWPHQVDIPVPDGTPVFMSLQIQNNGTATMQQMDDILQDLVDYLQEWPGRHPQANVTGQRYEARLYRMTTNNPIPPPGP